MFIFITRWFYSTNYKDIGTLYFIFGTFSGMLSTLLSVLIRLELAYPGNQFFQGSYQLYNSVIVKIHALFWCIFLFFFINNLSLLFNIKCILFIYLLLNINHFIIKQSSLVTSNISNFKSNIFLKDDLIDFYSIKFSYKTVNNNNFDTNLGRGMPPEILQLPNMEYLPIRIKWMLFGLFFNFAMHDLTMFSVRYGMYCILMCQFFLCLSQLGKFRDVWSAIYKDWLFNIKYNSKISFLKKIYLTILLLWIFFYHCFFFTYFGNILSVASFIVIIVLLFEAKYLQSFNLFIFFTVCTSFITLLQAFFFFFFFH